MGAGEPNLPVSPGVFIFTAERLKLPSSGPISQSCPWNESLSRPVPGPLVPKLENWRRNFLSPLLLLPPRVSVPGQPRSLAALPQRTNHRSAFFPTSEGGGTNARLVSGFGTVRSSGGVCRSCGGKRPTVPTRSERKSRSRSGKFPLNSPPAAHLDAAASSSPFGISAR